MVTGSRTWTDADAIDATLSRYALAGAEFVHGGAGGADQMAADWCRLWSVGETMFLPDYATHGSRAPHVRNDAMLDVAGAVVAFWDGKSRGTKSVIEKAEKRSIPVEVIRG
jgi:hypothetical protein